MEAKYSVKEQLGNINAKLTGLDGKTDKLSFDVEQAVTRSEALKEDPGFKKSIADMIVEGIRADLSKLKDEIGSLREQVKKLTATAEAAQKQDAEQKPPPEDGTSPAQGVETDSGNTQTQDAPAVGLCPTVVECRDRKLG